MFAFEMAVGTSCLGTGDGMGGVCVCVLLMCSRLKVPKGSGTSFFALERYTPLTSMLLS